jgi:hypothetical protein
MCLTGLDSVPRQEGARRRSCNAVFSSRRASQSQHASRAAGTVERNQQSASEENLAAHLEA